MKKDLRKILLARRDLLSKLEIEEHSACICHTLQTMVKGRVGIYNAIASEVNVNALQMSDAITCAYPKTYKDHTIRFFCVGCDEDLIAGPYGILEPLEIDEQFDLDFLVVPLVGFDEQCNRLGHGAGYYDRYLENYQGITIGVAHECQKCDNVFQEAHDIPLDFIITEHTIYKHLMK